MVGEDKSLDELFRLFLQRALYAGGGFGSDVNVTNNPLTVRPVQNLDGTGTPQTQVTNFPANQAVTVSNPTANPETGLAKQSTQTDGSQKTQVTNFPANQPVTVSNPTANPETGLAKQATQTDGSQKTQVTNFPVNQAVTVLNPTANPETGIAKDSNLITVRDTIFRRTDPLPSGSNFLGYTGNYEDDASKQGRYRFAGGKAATSVATPNASITLSNPAGSNVDLIVSRYSVESDNSAEVVLFSNAASTGTIQTNFNPNQRTVVANPGVVRVGAGALTGGTQESPIRRVTSNAPVAIGPFRFRITPGNSFTVRFISSGVSANVWFNLGWFVVDAGADLT